MKTLPWFRMYHESLDDEKLRLLAFEDRWHFVALLCCKAKGILDDGSIELIRRKVAVKLGLAIRELDEVARRLDEVDLIDKDSLQPLAWDIRQMVSDLDVTAAERKQRQREREKQAKSNVTDMSRVTRTNVTPTDTDKDTDKEIHTSATALPDCPHELLIKSYAKHLPSLALPRISLWRSGKNAPALKSRWRWVMTEKYESGKRAGERMATNESEALAWFDRFFEYVANSDFLTGKTGNFTCNLGWLVNQTNFEKVLSGNYENKKVAA